jgi:hypothetical protein
MHPLHHQHQGFLCVRGSRRDEKHPGQLSALFRYQTWQESSFLFPHAHVLLPVLPEVRPFLEAVKLSGAKVYRSTFQGQVLPNPFTILPPDRGPENAWEYFTSLPDLRALESLVDFRESTITALKNSPSLARYLAKTTYTGGLRPVIEHNV